MKKRLETVIKLSENVNRSSLGGDRYAAQGKLNQELTPDFIIQLCKWVLDYRELKILISEKENELPIDLPRESKEWLERFI